ncbi:MAG: pseudouridine synthase [Erysipelotrichales bacterium]
MKKAKESINSIKETYIKDDNSELVRLNKFIGSSGLYSRRQADRMIEDGEVLVDGKVAVMGMKVNNSNEVVIDGKAINSVDKLVYIVLNKPVNITCTTDPKDKTNIISYMKYPERIFPIGRLDKNSTGLILLTNDGDIVNKVLRSTYNHEKEYIVRVDKQIDEQFINDISNGVKIYNPSQHNYEITKKCKVEQLDARTFSIILVQGLNRQIRRMTKAFGYHVQNLQRIRIMNIELGDLNEGEWRYLSKEEFIELNKSINMRGEV